jgi:hypothetical protein
VGGRARDLQVDVHPEHLVAGDRAEDVIVAAALEHDRELDALAGRDVRGGRIVDPGAGDLEGVRGVALVHGHEGVGAGAEGLLGKGDVEIGLDGLHRGR